MWSNVHLGPENPDLGQRTPQVLETFMNDKKEATFITVQESEGVEIE
jgi:hypothetical protein